MRKWKPPHEQLHLSTEMGEQYSLARILGIWALASIPGALLYWLGLPFLDKVTEISVGYLVLIVLGAPYIWQLPGIFDLETGTS